VALLGLPESAFAGTGRLLSQWMSRAPRIDGQIAAGEWSEARLVDLGAGVTARIGNDARTLYLAILDSGDLAYGPADSITLIFDDEGGVAPVLDDSAWSNPSCQLTPLGEGQIFFQHDQDVAFVQYSQGTACNENHFITDRTSFRSAARPEGVSYETAIPLDGAGPLEAANGRRFGLLIAVVRDALYVACLPAACVFSPPGFQNLILASGGCNTGPQDFGQSPVIGLPLDWTGVVDIGTGLGWQQSEQDHEPELCLGNLTGGSGSAACVATGGYTSVEGEALLMLPLSVPEQSIVTVRFLANLQQMQAADAFGVLRRLQSLTLGSLLLWQEQHLAEQVEVTMDLNSPPYLGNPPIELIFGHYTSSAGTQEGGYAQVDDVELLCGPVLFSDAFESGLTTHWTADSP
jgi:hypothetical protein